MTRDECVNRILRVSQSIKSIKQKNEGKEYINAEIISNMEKTISKMKFGPPPKVQREGATNLPARSPNTYSQMFSDAGLSFLKSGLILFVSGGDLSFAMRKRCEIKYARKISDEEFKQMLEKMDT